jgi:hypothetical protein
MVTSQPDWSLIREITRVVHSAPCGGIHREDLAAKFCLPAHGPAMRSALGIAYRRKGIDYCPDYVVKPPRRT